MLSAEGVFHSSAAREAVWDVYTDVDLWPRWSDDIAWATLDGPYAAGARGRMKFRGLPASSWRVVAAEHPVSFVSEVDFKVARLVFDHELRSHPEGTVVWERVRFRGPLGPLVALLQRRRWLRRWPAAMGAMSELAYERTVP